MKRINSLSSGGKYEPLYMNLEVEGQQLTMELDTGASVSVIGMVQYQKYFRQIPLKKTKMRLEMYNMTISRPKGVIQVEVSHKERIHSLPLYVMDTGEPLLGRNWLGEIKPEWPVIKTLRSNGTENMSVKDRQFALDTIMQKYDAVFSPGCGKLKDIKATLKVKENAMPKFVKARPVPLAKKQKVEAVLDKLEANKIITRVSHSDWAAPIVTPAKKDGDLRVCGDFKVTINPQLDIDQYPLLRIEEIPSKQLTFC